MVFVRLYATFFWHVWGLYGLKKNLYLVEMTFTKAAYTSEKITYYIQYSDADSKKIISGENNIWKNKMKMVKIFSKSFQTSFVTNILRVVNRVVKGFVNGMFKIALEWIFKATSDFVIGISSCFHLKFFHSSTYLHNRIHQTFFIVSLLWEYP